MIPLCVDLDGTLIQIDLLVHSAGRLLRRNPFYAFFILGWLRQGKAYLKTQLAARIKINPEVLPYHPAFLAFLQEERRRGRFLVLVTASPQEYAESVAKHLGLFDEVMATKGTVNLSGEEKRRALVHRFGEGRFDYAANSWRDLPVWRVAHAGIVVNGSNALIRCVRQVTQVTRTF